MAKIKYIARLNGQIVGTRSSERTYTHAIVINGHDKTDCVVTWCGRLDLAQGEQRKYQRYGYRAEIVPALVAEKPPARGSKVDAIAAPAAAPAPAGRDFAAELAAARAAEDWQAHERIWEERRLANVAADENELAAALAESAAAPAPKPQLCYVVVPCAEPGKRIGAIKRGEAGYYLTDYDRPTASADTVREFVDDMNRRLGVDKLEANAMLCGSMFGWNAAAANSDHARDAIGEADAIAANQ